MKLPRDVSGDELTARLGGLGYNPTRQTGSHVRLTRHSEEGAQHTTIPRHRNLKIGTLNGILREVSGQLGIEKDELAERLFSK